MKKNLNRLHRLDTTDRIQIDRHHQEDLVAIRDTPSRFRDELSLQQISLPEIDKRSISPHTLHPFEIRGPERVVKSRC